MASDLWLALGIYAFTFVLTGMFILGWKYRYHFLSNRMRVRILGENDIQKTLVVKVDSSDKEFTLRVFGKERTFEIHGDRMFATGSERMPTLEYYADHSEPRDLKKVRGIATSSIRYRDVAKQKVMADLLQSFYKNRVENHIVMIVCVAVVVLSSLMLGVFINQKLESLDLPSSSNSTGEVIRP